MASLPDSMARVVHGHTCRRIFFMPKGNSQREFSSLYLLSVDTVERQVICRCSFRMQTLSPRVEREGVFSLCPSPCLPLFSFFMVFIAWDHLHALAHTHTYICVYTYIHSCIHICTHTYIHTYVRTYTHNTYIFFSPTPTHTIRVTQAHP